jgi:hypothetical protein
MQYISSEGLFIDTLTQNARIGKTASSEISGNGSFLAIGNNTKVVNGSVAIIGKSSFIANSSVAINSINSNLSTFSINVNGSNVTLSGFSVNINGQNNNIRERSLSFNGISSYLASSSIELVGSTNNLSGSFIYFGNNNSVNSGILLIGDNNTASDSTILKGSNNNVSDSVAVKGDNNSLSQKGILITGDNNLLALSAFATISFNSSANNKAFISISDNSIVQNNSFAILTNNSKVSADSLSVNNNNSVISHSSVGINSSSNYVTDDSLILNSDTSNVKNSSLSINGKNNNISLSSLSLNSDNNSSVLNKSLVIDSNNNTLIQNESLVVNSDNNNKIENKSLAVNSDFGTVSTKSVAVNSDNVTVVNRSLVFNTNLSNVSANSLAINSYSTNVNLTGIDLLGSNNTVENGSLSILNVNGITKDSSINIDSVQSTVSAQSVLMGGNQNIVRNNSFVVNSSGSIVGYSSIVLGGSAQNVSRSSFSVGGNNNTISLSSGSVGGIVNTIEGPNSFAVGGFNHNIKAGNSVFIGGSANKANDIPGGIGSGSNIFIVAGDNNKAGTNGILIGTKFSEANSNSIVIGGSGNKTSGFTGVVIMGRDDVTASDNNTVYLPKVVSEGDLTVKGTISASGSIYSVGTTAVSVSTLSITNYALPSAAMIVNQYETAYPVARFEMAGNPKVYITTNGLGINTANPNQPLTVVGNASATGVLTVDSNINTNGTINIADVNLYRSAADTLKTDDNLVVGVLATNASSDSLIVENSGKLEKRSTNRQIWNTNAQLLSGILINSYVPKAGNNGALSNSVIYENDSNIGVNTITPQNKLTVKAATDNTTDYPIRVNNSADNYAFVVGAYGASNRGGSSQNIDYTLDVGKDLIVKNNNTDSLVVKSGGNVGIGTVTPNNKLTVIGGISAVGNLTVDGDVILGSDAVDTITFNGGPVNFPNATSSSDAIVIGSDSRIIRSTTNTLSTNSDLILGPLSTNSSTNSVVVESSNTLRKRNINPRVWDTTGTFLTGSSNFTTNYIPKATNSAALANSQIFDNNTNVGIGTTTPNQKLTVNGAISSNSFIDSNTQFRGQDNDTFLVPSYSWSGDQNTGMCRLAADTIGFSTAGNERVRISSTGSVGISATSFRSGERLIVRDNNTNVSFTNGSNTKGNLLTLEGNSNEGISILTPNTNSGWLLFGDPEDNDVGALEYRHSDNTLRITVGGTERFILDSTGKLSVGTSSTAYGLNVVGEALIDDILFGNTWGSDNIQIGQNTLVRNLQKAGTTAATRADDNIAIGRYALSGLETGKHNIGLGQYSLQYSTSAENDIAIGYQAARHYNKTAGSASVVGYNVIVGPYAMRYHNGRYNVAIGAVSLGGSSGTGAQSTSGFNTGSFNNVIGIEAGTNITTGDYNLCLGYRAGYNLTTGNNNVLLGNDVRANDPTGFAQLRIGCGSALRWIDGNSLGNVAIGGNTLPLSEAQLYLRNTTTITNALVVDSDSSASTNVQFRNNNGTTNYGEINLASTAASFNIRSVGSTPINLQTGGSNSRLTITNTGNVGIGVTTPGQLLTVNGAISANGTFIANTSVTAPRMIMNVAGATPADLTSTTHPLQIGTSGSIMVFNGTDIQSRSGSTAAGLNLNTAGGGVNLGNSSSQVVVNGRLAIVGGSDVTLSSTAHSFRIGLDNAENLAIDANEIQARNNGVASTLNLNAEGGDVAFDGTSKLTFGSTTGDKLNLWAAQYGMGVAGNDFQLYSGNRFSFRDGAYNGTILANVRGNGEILARQTIRAGVTDLSNTATDNTTYQTGEHLVFAYGGTATDYTYICGRNVVDTNRTIQSVVANDEKFRVLATGIIGAKSGTISVLSDIRRKQDITDATSQWEDIKNIKLVNYRYKKDVEKDPSTPKFLGVIAQQVEAISPGLVFDDYHSLVDGTPEKNVKISIIYLKAVKALQEAMARIENLEAKVQALESVNS